MNRRRLELLVVALSLLALAAVAGATGAGGTARVQDATTNATPDAWFADDRVAVERGQVAAIDVRLNHTDRATVVVGSNASTYRLVVAVTDGNGDGKVGLQFDTDAAGGEGAPVATFRDADGATVRSETGLDAGLAAQGYSLGVYLNGTAGQPTDASILLVDGAATTTATPPPTTTATTAVDSTTAADSTTATATPGTTTQGQPGFGLLVALVGIVAAALLAIRR